VSFYSRAQYGQSVSEEDLLFIAEESGRIVGAVRLSKERGVRVLRGMRVAKDHQPRGIARRLLFRAANAVQGETCYCIPHRHLASFYQEAGFLEVEERTAPPFLVERLARYRSELGLDVMLMRRQPQQPPRPELGGAAA
jgi:predicted N-acetyltransferase YhbS